MLKVFPKVSILIPTYNQESYINRCVQSAVDQSYSNKEIIVSDDSNNGNTEISLKELIDSKKIKYFKNQSNLGRLQNYRKLLYEYATGEWILMLDGDDYLICNNYIESCINILMSNPSIIYFHGQHTRHLINQSANIDLIPTILSGKYYLSNPFKFYSKFSHLSTLYNKEHAVQANVYEFNDLDGFINLLNLGNFCFINNVVGVWRITNSNLSNSLKPIDILPQFDMLKYKLEQNTIDKTFYNSSILYYIVEYCLILKKSNVSPTEFSNTIRLLSQQCTDSFMCKLFILFTKFGSYNSIKLLSKLLSKIY